MMGLVNCNNTDDSFFHTHVALFQLFFNRHTDYLINLEMRLFDKSREWAKFFECNEYAEGLQRLQHFKT